MTDDNKKDPKIIVDEDWKTQVEAEKKAAEAAKTDASASAGTDAPNAEPTGGADESFVGLISSLAAQAMMGLGQIPDPQSGHPVVRPDAAKPFIDILTMLDRKTKGNLSEEETNMLDNVLHELRMAYLAVRDQSSESGKTEPSADSSTADSAE